MASYPVHDFSKAHSPEAQPGVSASVPPCTLATSPEASGSVPPIRGFRLRWAALGGNRGAAASPSHDPAPVPGSQDSQALVEQLEDHAVEASGGSSVPCIPPLPVLSQLGSSDHVLRSVCVGAASPSATLVSKHHEKPTSCSTAPGPKVRIAAQHRLVACDHSKVRPFVQARSRSPCPLQAPTAASPPVPRSHSTRASSPPLQRPEIHRASFYAKCRSGLPKAQGSAAGCLLQAFPKQPPRGDPPRMHIPVPKQVSGMQLRPPRAPPPRDVKAAVDKAIPASALSLWHELCEALMLVSPVLQQCAQCSSPSEATAKLLSLVAPSTAARYLQSFVRLQKALEELGVPCVTQVEPHHVLDALFILDRSKSDALSCVPNVLKAARWVFKILDLDVSSLYCPLIRALEVRPIRDRREAVPLLLAMVVALERIAMNTSEDGALRIFTGSVLVLLWASLRFSDGQHVQWDTILWDVASLRFVAEATKTTRGGMPAGCLVAGLLGDFDATSWCAHWLYLMGCCWDEMRRAGIITKPMGLFFTWSGSEFAPLSYAQALRLLRQVLLQSGFDATSVQSVTLHSAKVTLLAWSHEIGVCEEWRRVQGHHKGGPGASMPQLYSRNDVITQLRLQTVVRQQLLQGWRPMTVQARGARPPLLQPGVSLSSVGMLPAPEHSYFQRFPGGDSLPHSDGGAPAGILALAPAQQAEAAFSPCTEMEPPVCVGERAEPLPEEQRLELLQREAGSVSPPDSVAVDAFMQESSDEEVADAPDLGAADEFTLLRASSGVLHVAHALEQGKTACGVVSGLLEPVLEPGVGGRWCRRSACMRLRMQF